MGRVWRPKYLHKCGRCGWKGYRSKYPRSCPRCDFWTPSLVPKREKSK